jgi:Pyruvate/2-oxoacid:ferredoxin oxidoreductase delta subunit
MSPTASSLSRRDFFSRLIPARHSPVAHPPSVEARAPQPVPPVLAIIAGRHCLAYQNSFCSVCRERCPVPGAVVIERGIPRIDPAHCSGCRICHAVCPAPVNAIRLVPRPTLQRARAAAEVAPS